MKRIPFMRLLAGAAVIAAAGGASDAADTLPNGAPPGLNLSAPGVGWTGFIAPKEPNYAIARTFNDFSDPPSGIGPVHDGPAHPYANNEVAREMGIPPTFRVADLDNDAGRNLMPWVQEALKKQNALALQGKNGETREARCYETGVPAFHLNPNVMYFIQTPKEVVMFLTGRERHVWLNVPHSKNPKPSWYGESVGHYEGDTLVVDTIGLNDKTLVDTFGTPHTEAIHVVERYRVVNDGKALEVVFTVDDPKAFTTKWAGRMVYQRMNLPSLVEEVCAENDLDARTQQPYAEMPRAAKPDF